MPKFPLSMTQSIKDYPVVLYAQKAYHIPKVEAIYYKVEGDTISLWTQVQVDDRQTRDALYHIEADLEITFPDCLFDFYIFAAEGNDLLSEFVKVERWQI